MKTRQRIKPAWCIFTFPVFVSQIKPHRSLQTCLWIHPFFLLSVCLELDINFLVFPRVLKKKKENTICQLRSNMNCLLFTCNAFQGGLKEKCFLCVSLNNQRGHISYSSCVKPLIQFALFHVIQKMRSIDFSSFICLIFLHKRVTSGSACWPPGRSKFSLKSVVKVFLPSAEYDHEHIMADARTTDRLTSTLAICFASYTSRQQFANHISATCAPVPSHPPTSCHLCLSGLLTLSPKCFVNDTFASPVSLTRLHRGILCYRGEEEAR